MTTCPCCGSPVEKDAILICLDTNKLAVGWRDEPLQLGPMQAVFMHSLASASPRSVTRDRMIRDLWGINECESVDKCFDVHLYQLRRRIAPLDLRIVTVRGHPTAYRVELPTGT